MRIKLLAMAMGIVLAVAAPVVAQDVVRNGDTSVTASWYGKRYTGKPTASGEIFDHNALTAAHPFLPFGTLVEVRSVQTGRAVVVRVNDRGPHVPGRAIDLSEAAARKIGLLAEGVGDVTLRTLESQAWQ